MAIAHDYLTQRGGAERVVLAMTRAFPDAKVYTTLYEPEGTFPEFRDVEIVTSPLNRIGPLRRDHRAALPLLPFAAATLRVPADVVLVSTTGWAHGFPTPGRRLVYCHSPARWIYLRDEYLGAPWWRSAKGWLLAALLPGQRAWDRYAARRAEASGRYLVNSTVVQERVRRVYGFRAERLAPPHGVSTEGGLEPIEGLEDFADGHFLLVSRLLPYKNVDVAMEAFRGSDERLLVVGHGPLAERLRAEAPGNVRLASHLSDAQMRWAYSRAKGLVAPSREDFGLTPLEAAAWGLPVAALRGGGYLDTVLEDVTGVFFDEVRPEAIREAVGRLTARDWPAGAIREHAAGFAEERFAERLRAEVTALWEAA
ncbi:MAG: glycosyltransferase [Pseudoclavibacter sp.]|nr:glycosyltransferase [Pseudoclavibacter sp.]